MRPKRSHTPPEEPDVRCPHCELPAERGARFCQRCGGRIAQQRQNVCLDCAVTLPPEARFCSNCGRAVEDASAGAGVSEGERRHLTVMFCDLVESTALSERLEAESLAVVVESFHKTAAAVIQRHLGQVMQFLGDGVLAGFGYPQAHDDDPQLAVRTGLAIIEQLSRLNRELEAKEGVSLAVRIGIHSGLVIVSERKDVAHQETSLFGETVNLAARLQSAAEPDSVLISEDTAHHVQGLFIVQGLGPMTLKGISRSVGVFRVLRASGVRSRLDVTAAAALSPFVARRQELGMLLDRWEQVQEGVGQAVLLCGEAGIGKSRLIHEFKERLADTPHTWLECRCSDYNQNSALYPVIDLQRRGFGFTTEDTEEQRLEKVERATLSAGLRPADVVPFFAALHSLPTPDRYGEPRLSPAAMKRRTLEALAEWLLSLEQQQGVFLVVEDLQWLDPSTEQLIGLILDQLPTSKILAIFTHRPDFAPPWPSRSHVTPMLLNRLTGAQVTRLIDGVAGERKLPPWAVGEIVRDTDGIPLFVEELTKSHLERQDAVATVAESPEPYEGVARRLAPIPESLRNLLTARLDRLGSVKELAQFCSTLGRDFHYALVRAAYSTEEGKLRSSLGRLVESELLYQRGTPPHSTYLFKHALIRESAYQSLLKERRCRYHQRIAEALEREFPDTVATQPELLAHHYTEAGCEAQAIAHWVRAGQRALERSANVEVVRYLDKGLELLEKLPQTTERSELEVTILIFRGRALNAIQGYAAPDVRRNFDRARDVCRRLGETPQLFLVLLGLYGFYLVRSERKATVELVDQVARFAERSGEVDLILEANVAAGVTCFWRGLHAEAQAYLQKALDVYDEDRHASQAYVYGQDPAAYANMYAALSQWFSGFPDRALETMRRALGHAEKIAHPLTLAGVLNFASDLHHYRGEIDRLLAYAERGVRLSNEQGFVLWANGGLSSIGWALVRQGEVEAGIQKIRESLAATRATGAQINSPFLLAKLAASLLDAGEIDEGLTQVGEALRMIESNLDRCWEPELHRLKGELRARSAGDDRAGEEHYRNALAIAQRQGAKSLELRAAMSLARAWGRIGDRRRAHALLSETYGGFTEGFDTHDLQEARDLLSALAA